jgi:predicted NBD/HSP70 family sugar kinase
LPVIFDNVSRVMSLGELWYGIGREIKNFICVNIGHGIGAGIVIEGTPLCGAEGMAGEFGHITIDGNSQIRCKCGKLGCLEALASGEGIAAAAKDILKNTDRNERLMELCGCDIETVTAKMVAQAGAEGDELAINILNKAAEYIGIGIANMINLFNPEAVIIGGGVSNAGELLLSSIRRSVDLHVISRHINRVKIVPVTFGANAAVMGAVSLILGEILMLNHRNI